MLVKTYNITADPQVTLTAYITDASKEINGSDKMPAVLVLPGGGYRFCSDREAEPIVLSYLANGYNAFILRYSLNEKSEFPTPLNDAITALKFIRENAADFCIDPQRIAVCGFSAGGHLAAALCTMSEERPNACILGYPCILESIGHILAKPIPSVERYVTEQTPPTFIFAAADDGTVPIENSLCYALELKKHGVSFEMHIFDRGEHGFSLANDIVCNEKWLESCSENAYWLPRSVQWLKKNM